MWGMDGYYDYYADEETKDLPRDPKYCNHQWSPILLLTSTVYDCKLCGKKKEDWEAENAKRTS